MKYRIIKRGDDVYIAQKLIALEEWKNVLAKLADYDNSDWPINNMSLFDEDCFPNQESAERAINREILEERKKKLKSEITIIKEIEGDSL